MTVLAAPAIPDLPLFILELHWRRRDLVLGELVTLAHRVGSVRSIGPLLETLRIRERIAPSLLGKGAAFPALRSLLVTRPTLVGGRAARALDWSSEPDGQVRLVMLALAPAEMAEESWHGWLARVAALVRQQRPRQKLLEATTAESAAALMKEAGA
ncbi:MAG: PTS transporter subunit EIIA [Candidatus Eisenbacteria bacterium]|uniref:PTS transporter subunit EIIA n=1 Tax=Eiseniibacteriota bacterium TaxID=2212470 RepID=A0A849SN39_UNCEI|nr:PTS transporter subunit EIIA [Candidatus Eisenbacteria bacterium]